MNSGFTARFAIATISLALLSLGLASAQNPASATKNSRGVENAQTTPNAPMMDSANSPNGRNEAMQMVPGRAAVIRNLDANKLKPGDQFKVKLADTVHLKNGTELPHGTTLLGVVSTDDLHSGNSKLALCFTKAELKGGTAIPIKATIVGVFAPESENGAGYDIVPGEQQPNSWSPETLQVDQIDALKNVDLHSRIDGKNSGVFVTTKKDDVKLASGSELLLAIAPQRS